MNILLSWSTAACSNPLNQRVEYKKKTDSTWTLYASVPCGVTSIQINDLSDNTVYEFRVGTLCRNDLGEISVIYSAYTVQAKLTCPDVDIVPATTIVSYSFLELGGSVDNYDVQLIDDADNVLVTNKHIAIPTISGSFSPLAASSTYKIKVIPRSYYDRINKTDCPPEEFTTGLIDCSNANFVIIFVNDESGSIGEANFKNYVAPGILEMTKKISALITTKQISIGLVGFGKFDKTRLSISDDYNVVYNTLSVYKYPGSELSSDGVTLQTSGTNTPSGLNKALSWINAATRDVPHKVILITDGDPTITLAGVANTPTAKQETINFSNDIKATVKGGLNTEMIVVGVASANTTFLRPLASNPDLYYRATTFQGFTTIASEVAEDICANIPDAVPDPCYEATNVTFTLTNVDEPCIAPPGVTALLLINA